MFALPHIDDMTIFSGEWNQHVKHLDEVMNRLSEDKLKVKPSKCMFAQDHARFLGHEVVCGRRSPSEVKIKAIQDFPTPKIKTQIRAFLGLCRYYSGYINQYAVKAAPLTDALKGKVRKKKIEWNDKCEQAFKELKLELMKSSVLYSPDYSREFIIQTDASLIGAGIVLAQIMDEEEHPTVFLSKNVSQTEEKYSTIDRELAAIVYGAEKLRHYPDGQHFSLQTDHKPLTYLKKMIRTNSRLTNWALCLQQYNFKVVHKSVKMNGNADALSRSREE